MNRFDWFRIRSQRRSVPEGLAQHFLRFGHDNRADAVTGSGFLIITAVYIRVRAKSPVLSAAPLSSLSARMG